MSIDLPDKPLSALSDELRSAVSRIARDSDLYDVRTIATSARLYEDPPSPDTPLAAALEIALHGAIREDEFQILGKFRLASHAADKPKKQVLFMATVRLVAYYRLHPGVQVAHEELKAFARSNGMIHLWPYFRAFVQQTCGQFSMPPIVLPPFRANQPMTVVFGNVTEVGR